MRKAVNFGIDLGTTNSLIARFEGTRIQLFKNPVGQKETLASVVAFRPERTLVGDKAREYLVKDALNVFGNFKRKIGTDEKYYVVNIDDNVTPIQLSSLVLKELKTFIHTGEVPEACVITIPASFDSMQSNATLKAGTDAGFKEVFLLQEPIAASLAFFNQTGDGKPVDGHWLVYDFGGGTFDAALVLANDQELKIVDHEGNNFLGGADFDFAIIEKILVPEIIRQTGIENFEEELRVKYGKYERLYYEMLYYAEEAKKELSHALSTVIEFTATLDDRKFDFSIPFSRVQAEEIFLPMIDESIGLLKKVMSNNGLGSEDIRQVILVGGTTLLPIVRERVASQTGISINYSADPTGAIAIGAGYYAANKYYEAEEPTAQASPDALINDAISGKAETPDDLRIELSYSKSSRDKEEVLLLFATGDYDGKYYRIIRADGGFDSGYIAAKAKKTEFLPLLPSVANEFTLQVFDAGYTEIRTQARAISITQGKYTIDGQPLPHDICIEVDDVENHSTRLEVIFGRNSLLPQKRTLYREISKTIAKGSRDTLLVNFMEGDAGSRPSSNLTIGCIAISGKDLLTDLVKGSDIEINLHIDDSRVLRSTVFLVMTQQEFKNVFSLSEKQLNLERMREQYTQLGHEISETIQQFQYNGNTTWEIKATALQDELQSVQGRLFKLKTGDKSDEKYVISERIQRVSREFDRLGGNERMIELVEQYFELKQQLVARIELADFDKDEMRNKLKKIESSEDSFIRSKNVSFAEAKLKQLNDLNWQAMCNNTSFLIGQYVIWRELPKDAYKDYNAARSLMKMADQSLEAERFPEFRAQVFSLTHLLVFGDFNVNQDFKGTGIG